MVSVTFKKFMSTGLSKPDTILLLLPLDLPYPPTPGLEIWLGEKYLGTVQPNVSFHNSRTGGHKSYRAFLAPDDQIGMEESRGGKEWWELLESRLDDYKQNLWLVRDTDVEALNKAKKDLLKQKEN